MKILWFEVSVPARYHEGNRVVTGWQDSLEEVVRNTLNVELIIAFESTQYNEIKHIDGVIYVPIYTKYSRFEKYNRDYWGVAAKKVISRSVDIVKEYNPDIIHVFGTEWPFGLIAEYTNIPVVIHIQGSMIPYNNALLPPGFSNLTVYSTLKYNIRGILFHYLETLKTFSREKIERRIWKSVKYYMGRTDWDYALANIMHPNCSYFHVEEALRPSFISNNIKWQYKNSKKIKLLTIGHSGRWYWKGIDMLLKTARVLKRLNVDFEWNLVGGLTDIMKKTIENKTRTTFKENNINLLGLLDSEHLINYLVETTIYVQTSYVENSPNAICEAQYIGVPIISTNVGGISTLCHDKSDGILVPANDPYQMAFAIIQLAANKELMEKFSYNSIQRSHKRHDYINISKQLMNCYQSIIDDNYNM